MPFTLFFRFLTDRCVLCFYQHLMVWSALDIAWQLAYSVGCGQNYFRILSVCTGIFCFKLKAKKLSFFMYYSRTCGRGICFNSEHVSISTNNTNMYQQNNRDDATEMKIPIRACKIRRPVTDSPQRYRTSRSWLIAKTVSSNRYRLMLNWSERAGQV